MDLNVKLNMVDPDGFYKELIDSQRKMNEAEAAMMNCKLVLLLANHIGDAEVLRQALRAAGGQI